MTTTDQLLKSFDGLESDLAELLASYCKLKRDRKALLEAAKHTLVDLRNDCVEVDDVMRMCGELEAAIAQAESEVE